MLADPLFVAAAVIGVTCLGLGKGGFAGVGLVATPLLALVIPPLQAAAILLPILMLQDAISIWVYRRDWDAWNLKVLLPGAFIGVCIAWAVAGVVSDAAVRVAVGIIGLAFVLNAWLGRITDNGRSASAIGGVFWGAVSGFTSTLAQAGSPPFQIHVLPQRLPKMTFVGTNTLFFAAVNALKIVPYFALGQFSADGLGISAALIPLAIATNFLGIWLVRRTPQAVFYRIAYALVLAISLALLWQGARRF